MLFISRSFYVLGWKEPFTYCLRSHNWIREACKFGCNCGKATRNKNVARMTGELYLRLPTLVIVYLSKIGYCIVILLIYFNVLFRLKYVCVYLISMYYWKWNVMLNAYCLFLLRLLVMGSKHRSKRKHFGVCMMLIIHNQILWYELSINHKYCMSREKHL